MFAAVVVIVAVALAARYRSRSSPRKQRLLRLSREIQTLVEASSLPIWIGISGVPGAGKSTIASQLQAYLPPLACAIVSMDGYHYSRAELDRFDDPVAAHRFRGAPFTFNSKLFAKELREKKEELLCGKVIQFPAFDHALKDPVENGITVLPDVDVVIVEGNYLLLWKEALALDFYYHLDVDIETAKQRLARRHCEAWNWSMEQAIQRVEDSDYKNMLIVQPTRVHADGLIEDI